jgi:hypothetical protein
LSTGTYVGEDGLIKTAAANEARFDHDSDGNSLGLLIEEARTNYIQNSINFSAGDWGFVTGGTSPGIPVLTPNAGIAPDGTNTATRLTASTGGGTTASDLSYLRCNRDNSSRAAVSLWMKSNTGADQNVFATGMGAVVTPTWRRFTGRSADWRVGVRGDYSDPDIDILIWGAQVEDGTLANGFSTSYIPSSGSTVTRAADVVSITGTNFSSWYNQSEGSFVASADRVNALPSLQFTVLTTDGFRLPEFLFTNSGNGRVFNNIAGSYTTPTALTRATFGWSFDGTGASRAINGAGDSVATSLTDTNTILYIGNYLGSSSYRHNGHISRLTYYPVRLPDATLQALTL